MKDEFNKSATAMSREVETTILASQLTPTQNSEYQALLQGQEVTRVASERRIFHERPQLVQAHFNRLMAEANAPTLDLEPGVRDHAKAVRDATTAAERAVDGFEARRRAARDEMSADARWRFVKSAQAERLGKGGNGIDPQGK